MEGLHPPDPRNLRAVEEGSLGAGLHNEGLFDDGADLAGESIDLRTGEPFNDSDEPNDGLVEVGGEDRGDGSEDILPALSERNDAAAKWLRENDPNLH